MNSTLAAIILTLLGFNVGPGARDANAVEPTMKCSPLILDGDQGKAPLFSAIPLKDTPLAQSWAELMPAAKKEFPKLKFEGPADLHITLVYLGLGWPAARLEELSNLALVGPDVHEKPWHSAIHPEVFGRQGQVVVLKLDPTPEEWNRRLIEAKSRLNELGLKQPDSFDKDFNAHVTLARTFKPAEDAGEMKRFQNWIINAASQRPAFQSLELTPAEKPVMLLSFQPDRSKPRYNPLREFCLDATACSGKFGSSSLK